MNISLKWLNNYVDLSDISVDKITEELPMLGLEVESVNTLGLAKLDNVVVGEILSRDKHPDADKLGVCQVKISEDKAPIQIVCGASNYKVGDRVPVALCGAKLPSGENEFFEIKQSKLRGVESNGMMCSARELGMGTDHSGLLILAERPAIGAKINDVFIDSDTVFEVELTANRGDCASVIGIARELASKFNKKLKYPELKCVANFQDFSSFSSSLITEVSLETKNCPMYLAASIKGVEIKESPAWLKSALEAVGLRAINNVVDVTNFVMMEYGQPLHAFDAKQITSKKIVVRQAKSEEKIKTLDSKDHILNESCMLICDNERPVALAGIMGCENSQVENDTRDLIIESAYFNAGNIRSSSRKLAIHSDSAYRFARDVDPQSTKNAIRRAIDLILETAGGKQEGSILISGSEPRTERQIQVSLDYIIKILGFDVNASDVKNIFESLGFIVKNDANEKIFDVTVPSFRADIERPIDLVEEFIRLFGSDKIPEKRVEVLSTFRDDDSTFLFNKKACDYLANIGLHECVNYTLKDSKKSEKLHPTYSVNKVLLANPLASDQDCLRVSLLDSLLDVMRLNIAADNDFKGFFETGRIFRQDKQQSIAELMSVAFVIPAFRKKRLWKNHEMPDFFSAKKIICDLLNILGIQKYSFNSLEDDFWQKDFSATGGITTREGYSFNCGAISLSVLRDAEIDGVVFAGELILKPDVCNRKKGIEKFKQFSMFPASVRDLALIVPADASAESISFELEKISQAKAKGVCEVEQVEIFDVYQGKGLQENTKSIALSITFRSSEKTLQSEDIAKIFDGICTEISKKYQLRV